MSHADQARATRAAQAREAVRTEGVLMYRPNAYASPLVIYGSADDGGDGPTQTGADLATDGGPLVDGSYTVPAGNTLEIQEMGVCLDRPGTGASAWGTLIPFVYDVTNAERLAEDHLAGHFPLGTLSADHWAFFPLFLTIPEAGEIALYLDNPNSTRGRARFVVRGWLVPNPA